jgi:hypothetical protein
MREIIMRLNLPIFHELSRVTHRFAELREIGAGSGSCVV